MSLIILAILLIADGVLTYHVLKKGGQEQNPLMRLLMEHMKVKPALVATRVAGLALFALAYPHWLVWVACVFYAGVVGWNVWQWRKSNP